MTSAAHLGPCSYYHPLFLPHHIHIVSYTPDITFTFMAGTAGWGVVEEEIPREYLLMPHCPELYSMQDWRHDCLSKASTELSWTKSGFCLQKRRTGLGWNLRLSGQLGWKPPHQVLEVRCLKEQGRIDKGPSLFVFIYYPFPFYSCIID